MIDFTSALYLGLLHPTASLRPWSRLSTGKPAALEPPPGAAAVGEQIAALQGGERATLVPSTLHLFWDLFGFLADDHVGIYLDAGAYPIARWGVDRAAARGVLVRRFPHHDPASVRRMLEQDRHTGRRPLIIADGFCPGCGGPAPIVEYLQAAVAFGGYLVLDDTQALGILGRDPRPQAPYGEGGGGSLRAQAVYSPRVIVGSSLAKGFGVPVAALCGSEAVVRRFERLSETRVHSSPPSIAVIRAAEHALIVNRHHGDAIRFRLARLVRYFRDQLRRIGLRVAGGLFPVQTLAPVRGLDVERVHDRLSTAGVRAVLHRDRLGRGARLSFLLTASHTIDELDCAVAALAAVISSNAARLAV